MRLPCQQRNKLIIYGKYFAKYQYAVTGVND